MYPLYNRILPLLFGWFADRILGDPEKIPHPIVAFGHIIRIGEKRFNKGVNKKIKGGLFAFGCIVLSFLVTQTLLGISFRLNNWCGIIISSLLIFFCLAGKTLIREVTAVFDATDQDIRSGRKQLSRIVGRDTTNLSAQQIRTAALETLSENLSDGVIAPLFWLCLLGVPGMVAYKMINTLDSMIGYKNERYLDFGYWAATIDDAANFIPARLTAILMLFAAGFSKEGWAFVRKYGRAHASPNSGYPEAALAFLLNCRFGGPNYYSGDLINKPYIGNHEKELSHEDMLFAVSINEKAEIIMVIISLLILLQ